MPEANHPSPGVARREPVKTRVRQLLEVSEADDRASHVVDVFLFTLIVVNVFAAILETVPSIERRYGVWLDDFELASGIVFAVEYLLRIWSCTVDARYARPLMGRLKFALTPFALVDLIAIVPVFVPLLGIELRQLRILRLLRLLRAAKVARYNRALQLIGHVMIERRGELIATVGLMTGLLIGASSALYLVERDVQPDAFGSIPAAMWWAIATLTTVGYGDVTPVTALGRSLAAVVAVFGIGLFALPAGVFGAALLEKLQAKKTSECPHCGRSLSE
jgi:voltage-gated potassium channel